MKNFSIGVSFYLIILCLTLTTVAQDSKPSLTDAQKLSLYQSRDLTTTTRLQMIKNQSSLWSQLQKALEAQTAANDLVTSLDSKLSATPEGKDYLKAANDQQKTLQSVLKGVDQSKWKLNDPTGKPTDYDFIPVVQPKGDNTKK